MLEMERPPQWTLVGGGWIASAAWPTSAHSLGAPQFVPKNMTRTEIVKIYKVLGIKHFLVQLKESYLLESPEKI